MKKLPFIYFVLISSVVIGQAKLESWYKVDKDYDTNTYAQYFYDELDNLIRMEEIGYEVSYPYSKKTYIYEDERLTYWKWEEHPAIREYWYIYYEETISARQVTGGSDTSDYYYYQINEENCVVSWLNWTYKWENGNCIEVYRGGDKERVRTYNINFINPWYEEAKFFRRHNFVGSFSGNYNLMDTEFEILPYEHESTLVVVESIGPNPTILEYRFDGNLSALYYFNYYKIIDDVHEADIEPYKVFSVEYFDLYGRRITKPTKGYYIERKETNRGILSMKHFIP